MEHHRDQFWSLNYTIHIDDLEKETKCKSSKFSDDTKIDGKVDCDEDVVILQWDADRLSFCLKSWQTEFNVEK